ncbi:alginate lyase-domain-containing protein [Geranomyces variabilis]|nr:alginate lyase-domain-containing protein [Geranomyces variabilis]
MHQYSASHPHRRRNTLAFAIHHLSLLLFLLTTAPHSTHAAAYPTDPTTNTPLPNAITTTYISARNLWRNRDLQQSTGLRKLHPAAARVIRLADAAAADTNVYSVVNASDVSMMALPPSNDTHDFFTLAPHWVRNPVTPSGLPWVVDSKVNSSVVVPNPPFGDADARGLQTVVDDAWYAGLAYFWTGDEKYAEVVARRVTQWFVDEQTYMNSNLEYANYVPGRSAIVATTTDGDGILDIHRLLDAISLTANSPTIPPTTTTSFQTWCQHYLTWLQTSTRAQHESALTDYRGVHTDLQQIALSIYLNDFATATSILTNRTLPRLATQISPSGQIPAELAKTRQSTWDASVEYISAMFVIAHMTRNAPLYPDLFAVSTSDGRSLRGAVEFLLPYAIANGTGWPVVPGDAFKVGVKFVQVLKEAYVVWGDARYLAAVGVLQPQPQAWNPSKLWTPFDAFDVVADSGAAVAVATGVRGVSVLAIALACLWVAV